MAGKPRDPKKDSFAGRLQKNIKKAVEEKAAAPPKPKKLDSFVGRLQRAMAPPVVLPPEPIAAPALPAAPPVAESNDTPMRTGPVGQGKYVVRNGDCVDSIATKHGFFWETLWNDAANSELRSVRKIPNVLLPGDRVTIMEKRRKEEPGATEQEHRFRRRGLPGRLKMRFLKDDKPRAGEHYVLTVDGRVFSGQLDGEGQIDVPIAPTAKKAKLRIGEDARDMTIVLGSTDPISEICGVQGRLNNLGFDCGSIDDKLNERTKKALRRFQKKYGLPESGEPDSGARAKLVELNGN